MIFFEICVKHFLKNNMLLVKNLLKLIRFPYGSPFKSNSNFSLIGDGFGFFFGYKCVYLISFVYTFPPFVIGVNVLPIDCFGQNINFYCKYM